MPGATEAQSSALFAMLDSLNQELQIQAATVLKSFWEGIGKWQGKQLSKKQTQKVQKLKSILKE